MIKIKNKFIEIAKKYGTLKNLEMNIHAYCDQQLIGNFPAINYKINLELMLL